MFKFALKNFVAYCMNALVRARKVRPSFVIADVIKTIRNNIDKNICTALKSILMFLNYFVLNQTSPKVVGNLFTSGKVSNDVGEVSKNRDGLRDCHVCLYKNWHSFGYYTILRKYTVVKTNISYKIAFTLFLS